MRLEGKVTLVTGAGRGLGAGIACGLAYAGSHVTIVDINEDALLVGSSIWLEMVERLLKR